MDTKPPQERTTTNTGRDDAPNATVSTALPHGTETVAKDELRQALLREMGRTIEEETARAIRRANAPNVAFPTALPDVAERAPQGKERELWTRVLLRGLEEVAAASEEVTCCVGGFATREIPCRNRNYWACPYRDRGRECG